MQEQLTTTEQTKTGHLDIPRLARYWAQALAARQGAAVEPHEKNWQADNLLLKPGPAHPGNVALPDADRAIAA